MIRTKKFATKYQLQKLKRTWKRAWNTPVMTFSMGEPDMATTARTWAYEMTNKMAIRAGLPAMKKDYYGVDLKTGEFVKGS